MGRRRTRWEERRGAEPRSRPRLPGEKAGRVAMAAPRARSRRGEPPPPSRRRGRPQSCHGGLRGTGASPPSWGAAEPFPSCHLLKSIFVPTAEIKASFLRNRTVGIRGSSRPNHAKGKHRSYWSAAPSVRRNFAKSLPFSRGGQRSHAFSTRSRTAMLLSEEKRGPELPHVPLGRFRGCGGAAAPAVSSAGARTGLGPPSREGRAGRRVGCNLDGWWHGTSPHGPSSVFHTLPGDKL